MKAHGFKSDSSIQLRCIKNNDKILTKNMIKNLDHSNKEIFLGKTWNELGWGFEPC